jgi:hypothetical protein
LAVDAVGVGTITNRMMLLGKFYNPRLQFCNDTHVCCNDATTNMNTTQCCGSAFSLGKVGTAVTQLSPDSLSGSSSTASDAPPPTSSSSGTSTSAGAPSGTGGGSAAAAASQTTGTQGNASTAPSGGGVIAGLAVLAAALVLSLAALGLLVRRNRSLRRQLGAMQHQHQYAQAPPPPPPPPPAAFHPQQLMYQQYQHTGSTAVSGNPSPNAPKAELYAPQPASELVG